MKHSHRWIKSLIEGFDTQADENVRTRILEGCGRNCISRNLIARVKKLKDGSKDIGDFLEKLNQTWKHMKLERGKIYVEYEECYCPLVKGYPERLSSTFCNCSRGWIKELFESALKKQVQVKLLKSIKCGDRICRFQVFI